MADRGEAEVNTKRVFKFFLMAIFSAAPLLAQNNPYATTGIQGSVALPDGNPAKNIYIQLQPEGGAGLLQTATTDSAGHFSFDTGGAAGNYDIVINLQGYRPVRQFVMVNGPVTYVSIALTAMPGHAAPAGGMVPAANAGVPPPALEQYQRGLAAGEKGNSKDALSAFEKAVKIDPSFADAYRHLSALYADQNRFPDADNAIQKALKLQPENADSYAYQGYVYVREKQIDKAQAAFARSLSLSKDDWFAHLELGRLRYDQGQYDQAFPDLQFAHRIHPQALSVHLLLYDDLIRLKRDKEALAELDEIVRLFPKAPEAQKMEQVRPALAAAAAKQQP